MPYFVDVQEGYEDYVCHAFARREYVEVCWPVLYEGNLVALLVIFRYERPFLVDANKLRAYQRELKPLSNGLT